MKDYLQINCVLAAAILTGLTLSTESLQAQAPNSTDAAETTPRLADGTPDLNGVWDNGGTSSFLSPRRLGASICTFACEELQQPAPAEGSNTQRPPPDRPNYKPEHMAKVNDLNARQVEEDPLLRCINPGLPRIGAPDKIVQTSDQLVFLYDDVVGNFFRVIPTDGRGHRTDVEAAHLGDSIGYWHGDTLVVETVNLTDETWLIDDGSFHTTELRVVERLTRTGDTLVWQATAHDPAVLAEPWAMRPRTATLTDVEILQAPRCVDRDLPMMYDTSLSHDNPR